VGEQQPPADLELKVCKAKQSTNIRSAGAEVLDTLAISIQTDPGARWSTSAPTKLLESPPSRPVAQAGMKKPDKAIARNWG